MTADALDCVQLCTHVSCPAPLSQQRLCSKFARPAAQEEAAAANGSQEAPLPVDAGDEDDDEPMIVGEMDLDESLAV